MRSAMPIVQSLKIKFRSYVKQGVRVRGETHDKPEFLISHDPEREAEEAQARKEEAKADQKAAGTVTGGGKDDDAAKTKNIVPLT